MFAGCEDSLMKSNEKVVQQKPNFSKNPDDRKANFQFKFIKLDWKKKWDGMAWCNNSLKYEFWK